MDFSKLSSNEKLAVYGSVATIIGGLVGGLSGLIWLSVLAAIGVLVVLFLPMMSPGAALPGSRGSLLVALGGIVGVAALLALLTVIADIGFWFDASPVRAIFFLIAVAAALFTAWICWQEFQAEGGKFQMGAPTSGGAGTTAASPPPSTTPPTSAPPPPSTTPPPSAPPAEPMAPPGSTMAPPSASEPAPPADTDDDRV